MSIPTTEGALIFRKRYKIVLYGAVRSVSEGLKAKARALLWFHGGTDAGFPYTALGDGLFESVVAEVVGVPCRFHPMSRPSTPGGAA